MKSDYIEREDIRHLMGVVDRVDYFSQERALRALEKGERYLTRDAITNLINYILELETFKKNFIILESSVLASSEAKNIFGSCKFSKAVRVTKNGSLAKDSGPGAVFKE